MLKISHSYLALITQISIKVSFKKLIFQINRDILSRRDNLEILNTEERLMAAIAEYEYLSEKLGYVREKFNYYARIFGPLMTDQIVNQLVLERNKVQVEIDFLNDIAKG
jgi:hypothetical protein